MTEALEHCKIASDFKDGKCYTSPAMDHMKNVLDSGFIDPVQEGSGTVCFYFFH